MYIIYKIVFNYYLKIMYYIYIMPVVTIQDLQDNAVTPAQQREVASLLPFEKSKKWIKNMVTWLKIAEANSDTGIVLPVPLKPKGKMPASGIVFAMSHSQSARWSKSKMSKWIKSNKIHKNPYDLGILFSGGIGMLDFDCEKDYKWFCGEFLQEKVGDYIVMRNRGKHNCQCDNSNEADGKEFTYHLYFEMDEFWSNQHNATPCCFDPQNESMLHIDFLRDSFDLHTPHIAKVYEEGSERTFIHKGRDKDLVIRPLPPLATHYFKTHWRKTAREKLQGERCMKYVELVEAIPVEHITSTDMVKIMCELKGIGIDRQIIEEQVLRIYNDPYYEQRIGAGPTTRYTEEEIIHWVTGILNTQNTDNQRRTFTIDTLCKTHNAGGLMTINTKWLDRYGKKYDVAYLRDLKFNITDPEERGRKVIEYYNHFFVMTTGMKKNAIWSLSYDCDGKVCDVKDYQDKSQFMDYCGIKMICFANGKEVNTAKWWFDEKRVMYNNVTFRPYGLIHNEKNVADPTAFNTFTGYKMKYKPDYKSTPEIDKLGDMINDHLKYSICWDDGKGKGSCNEEYYNFYRGWLYKLIVKGERTHICMVQYSKQMGSGKSLWSGGLMKYVIGEHISMLNSSFNKMIKDTFTDYWDSNVLTTLEEMPEYSGDSATKAGWDMVKSLITEDKMTARRFMTAPDQMDLWVNLLINTNHFYAIPQMLVIRRACANRVCPYYSNDVSHWNKIIPALTSEVAWENFIHRHIIKSYNQFSHIPIIPNEEYIINTKYRRELLARGNDCLIYFFKELMELLEDDDNETNPYEKVIGTHLLLSSLFDRFTEYKFKHNICESDNTKNLNDFEKKIMAKMEIEITAIKTKHKEKELTGKEQQLNKKHRPKVCQTRMGKCIVMSKETITHINSIVKQKCLNAENEILITESEYDDKMLDLDSYYNNELDFASDDDMF